MCRFLFLLTRKNKTNKNPAPILFPPKKCPFKDIKHNKLITPYYVYYTVWQRISFDPSFYCHSFSSSKHLLVMTDGLLRFWGGIVIFPGSIPWQHPMSGSLSIKPVEHRVDSRRRKKRKSVARCLSSSKSAGNSIPLVTLTLVNQSNISHVTSLGGKVDFAIGFLWSTKWQLDVKVMTNECRLINYFTQHPRHPRNISTVRRPTLLTTINKITIAK